MIIVKAAGKDSSDAGGSACGYGAVQWVIGRGENGALRMRSKGKKKMRYNVPPPVAPYGRLRHVDKHITVDNSFSKYIAFAIQPPASSSS